MPQAAAYPPAIYNYHNKALQFPSYPSSSSLTVGRTADASRDHILTRLAVCTDRQTLASLNNSQANLLLEYYPQHYIEMSAYR